jgi:hypothetical protein
MATKLRKLQINEVSLCDAGANEGARIMLFKRDIPSDEIEVPRDSDRHFGATGRGPAHDRLMVEYDNRRRSTAYPDSAFRAAWDDLDPDEKQEVRNEEAAHAAAVQAAADGAQKESQRMSDTDVLIKSAHAIACGDMENDLISASRWHAELRKMAAAVQAPGESIQQSVTRLVLTDPDAKALFKAAKTGTVDDVPPAPEPARMLKKDSAYARLHDIGAGFIAADPSLTREQAFVKAFNENRELAELSKREQAFV